VYYRVVHEPPDLNGCPPQLRALIEPCLAKQPADRPQLDQILRFCLERADAAAGSTPAQALYRPAEMVTGRQAAPPPSTMTAGVAPQSPPAWTPSRPVPPQPVMNAVRLIYLGGAFTAGRVAVATISDLPAVRAAIHLQGVSGATVAGTAFTGLVAGGLWLWMARQVKRGWSKARVTAATLFAISTIAIFAGNAGGISNYLAFIFDLAGWGVGLFALVSLWDQRSNTYFAELNYARSLAAPEWPKRATPQAGGPRHGKT
jgi:hypothetical protein